MSPSWKKQGFMLGPLCNQTVKGAMSLPTHARANENKLEKLARLFQNLWEILEGCFYLSKSQPTFDSLQSFVLRIILWWLQKNFLALFWNCLPIEFFYVDLKCPVISGLLLVAIVMAES